MLFVVNTDGGWLTVPKAEAYDALGEIDRETDVPVVTVSTSASEPDRTTV